MDDFDLDDDDSFAEGFLQAATQVESQTRIPAMCQQAAPLTIEQDDSLDDAESLSQARESSAGQQPVTPCPPKAVDTSGSADDEFGIFDDEEFLAAFEAVESTTKKHGLSLDESRPRKKTKVEAINFAQTNRQRPSALEYKPWTTIPQVGEVDFGQPDFQDPGNFTSLELVEQQARSAGLPMTAELQAILRNAFTAGYMSQHRAWKRRYTYDFLTLPAEIRLSIYSYALRDTNPTTAGGKTQALPTRKRVLSIMDFFSEDDPIDETVWPDADEKPWINLALLRTCKQVYRETRNEFLYRHRQFNAKAVLDEGFKHVMKLSPKLTFWQHIQHIHIILRPVDNSSQWARHVHKGVDSLTALLRGGKKLKSFQLSWQFTQFADHIKYFGSLKVLGPIVITQHFDDASVKDGQTITSEREDRIKSLIKTMQGLQPSSPEPTTDSASPEPRRYIPPHLQPEILEAAVANGERVSSASSPSEAYAGLCLDSIEEPTAETTTGMSADTGRRDSLSREINGVTSSNTGASSVSGNGTQAEGTRSRSQSPAKRRAEEMEDGDATDKVEQMEVDGSATPLQKGQSSTIAQPTLNPSSSRETRDKSVDMLGQAQTDGPAKDLPSIDDQVQTIMEQMAASQADTRDGDIGFAVSMAWLNRVLARCSASKDHGPFDKSVLEGEIGPIDNSDILLSNPLETSIKDDYGDVFVPLKPGMAMATNLEILPFKAYKLIKKWYGVLPGQAEIQRYAHATAEDAESIDQHVQWELYPPIFTIRKLAKPTALGDKHKVKDSNIKAPRLVASRSNMFHKFLLRAKEATMIPKETKVKVWRVLEVEAASNTESGRGKTSVSMLSPPASHNGSSRESSPAPQPPPALPLLLSKEAFKNMAELTEREHVDMKDETNNPNYNGSIQLGTLGLAADQVLILEEQLTYLGKEEFTSDIKATKNGKTDLISGGILGASGGSGRSSPVPAGAVTRGRHRQQGRSKGTVGLTNLGNTCYMNSALQCVRANAELTTFFLAGQWTNDLNPKNPLGYGGAIAKQYQVLLDSIYKQNNSSLPPRTFKNTLGKYGPQFSGFGQQDSQEFMSFLLDALHEDLNRIDKKPYIENPDSDDNRVADPEYVKELGEIYRSNYRKRNDSVVTDLFNGFYKNMMVCPICNKVSITFDPYSLLTLQLPIEHSFQFQFMYYPLYGAPIMVDIDMEKHSTIRQVKEYIGSKMNADAKRIMLAETFNNKFFRTCDDKTVLSESNIQPRDAMVMYELEDVPSNFPPPKKKTKAKSVLLYQQDSEEEELPHSESPLRDRMMVPVFFRAQLNAYNNNKSLVLTPTFIIVRRDEQVSYTEIYRKVLARIANQTTRPFLTESEGEAQSGTSTPATDQDVVITTEEDAADPSLATRSVESEDGMVDVLMDNDVANAHSEQESSSSPTADTAIASVLRPGTPIPESLWSIMELKIMPAGTEMISTGWNSVDGSKNYTTMSSRLPKVVESSPESSPAVSPESSDVDEILEKVVPSAQPSFSTDTHGENEDEDDDRALLMYENNKPSGAHNPKVNGKNGKKKNRNKKKMTTYSKKGQNQHRPQKQTERRASASPEATKSNADDGNPALVRIGEAIVVDFDYGAYDALFNGDGHDSRGQDTSKSVPVLPDPILEEKRSKRAANKKNGISLDDCFTATSKGEVLTEENQWYCNRCKELRQAEKTLEIWTAPDVLVIHLKRFSASRNLRDKIDVRVDFPIDGLDLTDRVGVSDGKTLKYDLFAVDNHYGGLGGGHYTAFAKNFLDDNWYEYNDSSVSQCSPTKAITSAAYLLFYRRQSNDAPLGPAMVNNWFRKYWDGGDESDSSSRAESPANNSGKGQRLGEVTSKGSSSALVVAGAGRHPRGGAGGSAATSNLANNNLDDSYDGDEDEGVGGMDYDDQPSIGPALPGYGDTANNFSISDTFHAGWGFGSMLNQEAQKDDDNDSMTGIDGEEEVGGADLRHMEAFGDDGHDYSTFENGADSGHHGSPVLDSLEYDEDVPDVIDYSHGLLADHSVDNQEVIPASAFVAMDGTEDVDEEVAEVRLEDDEAVVDHAKKE
ncbi:putative ubiquitin carboxyl-terminal hydrolase 12 [Venturia nashicola]|uniref:ubiquitinyl hydrolase 1 n=1 Tax=Venturia nashicola TaxID=86259 RepID=A0A4Z1NVR9_9PEZI|nr:putative ubiquitin carboxyl-terminal hydrolase 12 [Venturia nashicola]